MRIWRAPSSSALSWWGPDLAHPERAGGARVGLMAGVAGKDTRRKLPFPPMWERDGQAPELQEHGPGGAGVAAAQELGSLGTWVSRGYVPPCHPAGPGTCSCIFHSVQRVLAIAPVRLPTYRSMYPSCVGRCGPVPPHQSRPALGSRMQHMVIIHSLTHLLYRSIIQINHACIPP